MITLQHALGVLRKRRMDWLLKARRRRRRTTVKIGYRCEPARRTSAAIGALPGPATSDCRRAGAPTASTMASVTRFDQHSLLFFGAPFDEADLRKWHGVFRSRNSGERRPTLPMPCALSVTASSAVTATASASVMPRTESMSRPDLFAMHAQMIRQHRDGVGGDGPGPRRPRQRPRARRSSPARSRSCADRLRPRSLHARRQQSERRVLYQCRAGPGGGFNVSRWSFSRASAFDRRAEPRGAPGTAEPNAL